uniref:CSC1/OSCA1-like cytosolic domain-containing protein n=1 Tax=Ditylum brightwellii TaxID=49249 RepID=A0A7S4VQZ8_9STRA
MKDEKDKPKLRNRKKLQNEKSHISQRFVSRGGLSDDEIKERMSQYRHAEDTSTVMHKTLTRRLVSKLRNYAWYYPQQSEDNPSLKDAWCYYEHMTLPRYREDETRVAGQAPERALPGESNTELYGVWSTPTHWLKDFGIGVGLYFTTLKLMAVIFFLAGCISIPNIMFYASDEYSGPGGQDSVLQSPVMSLARGTMICTKREFVACPTCTESQLGNVFDFAKTPDNTPLVLRTLCEGAELTQGMVNWASFIFMVIAFALIALYQSQIEIRFNEDQVTVTDYSIVVENPPPDATDPDVWRDFFEQFSEKGVTVVTIALNNEALVRSLAFRRHFRNNLRYHLPPGTNIDNNEILKKAVEKATEARKQKKKTCFGLLCNCTLLPILRIFGLFLKEDQLYERVQKLTPQIQELQTKKYSATKVFVTFETEAGQRNALTALTLSKWDSWSNNKNSVGPSSIFQDTLLKIQEPTEPDAVRWLDLSATTKAKIIQRIITLAITIGLVIASGFSINAARNSSLGVTLSSIVLTLFNLIIPFIVKLLLLIEKHTTEGGRQASLYYKIALFRWVNTAIIPIFISSFTSWIGNDSRDIIITINSVLLSELLLSPTLRLLDIITTYRKHYLAPREKTQRNMNSHFNGTHYNLAERYTDLTKVIFLCFFYSPLFPSIYFYCTAIFIQQVSESRNGSKNK